MGNFFNVVTALVYMLNLFMPAWTQQGSCDFYQELIMGKEYYIYNRQYPNFYGPFTSCRWTAKSQVGTRIVIACTDISIPKTTNCYADRLSISLTGNARLYDSRNFCGSGSVTLVSAANALTVGLFSTGFSAGGRFVCTITSIYDSTQPTTEKPNNVCNCGWKQETRIVGGQETGVNEYPSVTGLMDIEKDDLYCGGSIISTRYILSAAHCVYERQASNIAIVVGKHNSSTDLDTTSAARYSVSAFEIHPSYDPTTQLHDISILQTSELIDFTINVGPICLPFRYTTSDFYGQIVTVLGWGQLEFSGPRAAALQEVQLTVTTNNECAAQNTDPITPAQICTFAPGKDACQSDSGGPLIWTDTSTQSLQLVGVISHGLGCATYKPGINTRVTAYLTWIVSRTIDANYCIK